MGDLDLNSLEFQVPAKGANTVLARFKQKVFKDITIPKIDKARLLQLQNELNHLFITSLQQTESKLGGSANEYVEQWIQTNNTSLKEGFKAIKEVENNVHTLEQMAKLSLKNAIESNTTIGQETAKSIQGAVNALAGEAFEKFLAEAFQQENMIEYFGNDVLKNFGKVVKGVTIEQLGSKGLYQLPKSLSKTIALPGKGSLTFKGKPTLGKTDIAYSAQILQEDGSVASIVQGISAKNLIDANRSIHILSETSVLNMLEPWRNFGEQEGNKAIVSYLRFLKSKTKKGQSGEYAHSIFGMMGLAGRQYISTNNSDIDPTISFLAVLVQSDLENPIRLISVYELLQSINKDPVDILGKFVHPQISNYKSAQSELEAAKQGLQIRAAVVRKMLQNNL